MPINYFLNTVYYIVITVLYLRVPSFDIFATGVSEARQTLKLPFIGLPE